MKVITVVGTRPEIIKLSRVIPALDKYVNHVLVNTRQNFTDNLNENFFRELKLRKPDYSLTVDRITLGKQIADILVGVEQIFLKEKPEAVLILGDTNSGLSSIIAKRRKIPIFHMEAGNRCFDENVPEEVNRKIIDHISEINIAYTENSRLNLISEGINPGTIYVTGSPLAEVLSYYGNDIDNSKMLQKKALFPQKYFLISLHREETVDNKISLRKIIFSISYLHKKYKYPVIFSVHPRTKDRIRDFRMIVPKDIVYLDAFGFFDYCKLQKNALCVLSDSGTIQEESAMLNFPAIQIRTSSERPEAFDMGTIILSGHNTDAILQGVEVARKTFNSKRDIPWAYKQMNVSGKILKLILGLGSVMQQNLADYNRRLFI